MEAAINDWKELYTDEDAHYDKVLTLDVNELVPFVTWGTNPEMGVPFDGTFPQPHHRICKKLMITWI